MDAYTDNGNEPTGETPRRTLDHISLFFFFTFEAKKRKKSTLFVLRRFQTFNSILSHNYRNGLNTNL